MEQIGNDYNRNFHGRAGVGFLFAIAFSVVTLIAGLPLVAQVQTGISGTVIDTTGAVIQHARVTVTSTSTGVESSTTSSSAGIFTVLGLLPGTYAIAADGPGFKKVLTTVVVDVAKISTVNLTLSPGTAAETVKVTGSTIALETDSPAMGTTLAPELVQTAPLEISGMARQIDSFITLTPGVQETSPSGSVPRAPSINGGLALENGVEFNGVPVAFVQNQGAQTYINPPYEAVSEFRLDNSTFDAQHGLGQGAVTFNMASGTDQFHGDVFEILRNQLFDSAGFFPTRFDSKGRPLPPIDQENNYGFTIGGPIIIPQLYDGRKRTFFHFSSDWFRQNQAQTAIGTVPTAAMKKGDFSNFVDANGNQIPIYDPTTGNPFPGNVIPEYRFSSVAKALLPLIPDPNRPGTNFGLQNNEGPAVHSLPVRQLSWAYTIDHYLTSSQSIHFTEWRDSITSPSFSWAPIVPASSELQSERDNSNIGSGFLLNYIKAFTPNLVMTAGADAIEYNNLLRDAKTGVSFPGAAGATTLPLIRFDGQNAITNWGAFGGRGFNGVLGGLTDINNWNLGIVVVNNWMWSRGRHTFNFGGQFRKTYQDDLECSFCGGGMNFSQRTTSTPNSNDPNFSVYGSSFASFLLGDVDAAARIKNNYATLGNRAYSLYVQDSYHVKPRLTASLGLRYDILVPFTEAQNNVVFPDRNKPDPGAGNLPGGLTKFGHCQGCAGFTRAPISWRYFQPRVGFSYEINNKTVLQSGFFISVLNGGAFEYGTSRMGVYMGALLAGSFLRNSTGSNTPGFGNWDTQPLPLPPPTAFGPSIGDGNSVYDFPIKHVPPGDLPNAPPVQTAPYIQSWNIRIQRELPWNNFLSVAYVGNRTVHLPTTNENNDQVNPSVLKYSSLLGDNILDPAVVAAGFTPPYPEFVQQFGPSATLEQALEPYPQFAGFSPSFEQDGTSFYNALQVQGEKRFSNGLSYLANFTLSKTYQNNWVGSTTFSPNSVNSYYPQQEWAPAAIDQKYAVNVVATYQLPFETYLHSSSRLVSELVGGWQISTILNYAGGNPFGVNDSQQNPLLVNGFNRANVVPGVSLKTFSYSRSMDYFRGKTPVQPVQFTTNAFAIAGTWQVGDALRSYSELRTPPLRIEDFAAFKTFTVGERVRTTLRVDYFNAFNRTRLNGPDTEVEDSTFGQITNLGSQISNRQGQATIRIEF
ncbi:MAG: carboxypeptidase regulatory-like domain-containing protein [Terriglobales bacterium]